MPGRSAAGDCGGDDGGGGAYCDGGSVSGGVPCLERLLALLGQADGLPLRFAVLEGAEPCFFGAATANLLDMVVAHPHLGPPEQQ